MSRVELNQAAPDFELTDINGAVVSLSDFRSRNDVVLVFNRGFM